MTLKYSHNKPENTKNFNTQLQGNKIKILPQILNEGGSKVNLIKLKSRPILLTISQENKPLFSNKLPMPLKSPMPNIEITPRVSMATHLKTFSRNFDFSKSVIKDHNAKTNLRKIIFLIKKHLYFNIKKFLRVKLFHYYFISNFNLPF